MCIQNIYVFVNSTREGKILTMKYLLKEQIITRIIATTDTFNFRPQHCLRLVSATLALSSQAFTKYMLCHNCSKRMQFARNTQKHVKPCSFRWVLPTSMPIFSKASRIGPDLVIANKVARNKFRFPLTG